MASPAQPAAPAAQTINARDAGLLRVVGSAGLAFSIIGVIVGAGIFALPSAMAAAVGRYAPLAFLACAAAVGAVALCFAEGGSRVPTSGGTYGYVTEAFGPLCGYVAGTLLWVGDVLANGGIAAGVAAVGTSLAPVSWAAPLRALLIIVIIGGIALINVGGVARGTRLITLTTSIKLVPLLIFVAVGAVSPQGLHLGHLTATPLVAPAPHDAQLGRALILGVFAFAGMETSLAASGEVRAPQRTIPRALLIALSTITVLYVAIQLIAQRLLGASLAHSVTPLADAMGRIHPALRVLMLAGTALSMLGFLASDLLGTPRVLFALARDRLLPSALGRLHARTHAPYVAILLYALLAATLALSGTFTELAVLSSLVTAALYVLACAAAWQLKRRAIALAGEPLNLPLLELFAAIGIATMLALVALASWPERAGLAGLIALAVAGFRLSRQPHASVAQ